MKKMMMLDLKMVVLRLKMVMIILVLLCFLMMLILMLMFPVLFFHQRTILFNILLFQILIIWSITKMLHWHPFLVAINFLIMIFSKQKRINGGLLCSANLNTQNDAQSCIPWKRLWCVQIMNSITILIIPSFLWLNTFSVSEHLQWVLIMICIILRIILFFCAVLDANSDDIFVTFVGDDADTMVDDCCDHKNISFES